MNSPDLKNTVKAQLKKTAKGLVAYCFASLGRPYWYGTFGQVASKWLLENRRKTYPRYYTATDFESQIGQIVQDCVGLIKGYFWKDSPNATKYAYQRGLPDVSADGLYSICTRKSSKMSAMPDEAGIAVFMQGHVGVYVGDGWVIEARGHAYGVVKTRLSERPWKRWAYIKGLDYSDKPENAAIS